MTVWLDSLMLQIPLITFLFLLFFFSVGGLTQQCLARNVEIQWVVKVISWMPTTLNWDTLCKCLYDNANILWLSKDPLICDFKKLNKTLCETFPPLSIFFFDFFFTIDMILDGLVSILFLFSCSNDLFLKTIIQ